MEGMALRTAGQQQSASDANPDESTRAVSSGIDSYIAEPMVFPLTSADLDEPMEQASELPPEDSHATKWSLKAQDDQPPAKIPVDMTIAQIRSYVRYRRQRDLGIGTAEETDEATRNIQRLNQMMDRLNKENASDAANEKATEAAIADTSKAAMSIDVTAQISAAYVSNMAANIPEPTWTSYTHPDAPSLTDPMEIHEKSRRVEFNALHFSSLELQTGDTLVYIDYPGEQNDTTVARDCYRYPWVSQAFRVHSDRLLDTGSSKFAEMLKPTYQFRVMRRRKLVYKLPEGVKYVLDLTPPTEGDDLVFQVTELSLTPGIQNWWRSFKVHRTAPHLVKGHDDVCDCVAKPVVEADPEVSGFAGDILAYDSNQANDQRSLSLPLSGHDVEYLRKSAAPRDPFTVPEHYGFKDYCAIRHRNSIIRLMLLIHGHYVPLHSATTMWTLVGVAKIFDCPLVVSNTVSSWMLAKSNTVFIEVLPEEAIKIAFDIQDATIAISAYRILVNELALENANTTIPRSKFHRVTIFGRTKGDPGDEISNLIQHGARAMVERATMTANQVTSDDAPDNWDIPEWGRLCTLESLLTQEPGQLCATALDGARSLKKTIKQRIEEEMRYVFYKKTTGIARYASVDFDRAKYVEPKNWEFMRSIVSGFNTAQKFLLPYVYDGLEDALAFDRLFEPSSLSIHAIVLNSALTEIKRNLLRADSACLLGEEARNLLLETNSAFPTTAEEPWFKGLDFYQQLKDYMYPIARMWQRHDFTPLLNLTQHMLLNLTANELRFLPLWAGGCNDDTGGVFEDILPPASMGPIGPGPCYRTGMTVGSDASSIASSFVGEMNALEMRGTDTLASIGVNDSISTIYRPDEVIADDVSIAPSDSFSVDNDYIEARMAAEEAAAASEQSTNSRSVEFMEDLSDDDSTSTIGEDDFDSDLDMFE